MRTVPFVLLVAGVVAAAGCALLGPAKSEQEVADLVAQNQANIRISSRLATVLALGTIDDPQELHDTASYVRLVAVAVEQATNEGDVSMEQVRTLAQQLLDEQDMTAMQRLAAGEILLTVSDLIESVLEQQFADTPKDSYLHATRMFLNAAAVGVRQAAERVLEQAGDTPEPLDGPSARQSIDRLRNRIDTILHGTDEDAALAVR